MARSTPALVAVAMLLAGCGATHKQRLSTSTEPTTALADAYDNAHLDGDWSCSLLRKAVAQLSLSPDAYTPIARMVGQAEGQACDRALARVHRGLTPAQVDALLGRPDDAARCRLYRWMPDADSSTDGARVCFEQGRVSAVQIAMHL